jgi:hypothetical protein
MKTAAEAHARLHGRPAAEPKLEPLAEPRRLTPTERLHEVTMAAMSRAPSPPEHSVEITRNAKGVAQFEVTVRGYDVTEVLAQARAIYVALEQAMPYPETNGGTA